MAPQRYDRPFCEYQEMVNHLVHDYGLIIKDNDFAIHALKVFTYYDLVNGYKDSLMINERYRRGITIELLCKLRIFDKDFQNILFSRMIMIENFFKNTLSYIIAKNFGVNHKEYLHLKNYNYAIKHINFLNTLKEIHAVIDSPHTPMPTAHYKNNHNHIPPWILFKNISFSNSINLFRALKAREKDYIVNELLPSQRLDYPKKVEFLTSGLNLLRKCRNQIAHNLKFDFQIAGRTSEILISSFNSINRQNLSSFLFDWLDIKEERIRQAKKDVSGLAIINDIEKPVDQQFLNALSAKGTEYILFSQRNTADSIGKLNAA